MFHVKHENGNVSRETFPFLKRYKVTINDKGETRLTI